MARDSWPVARDRQKAVCALRTTLLLSRGPGFKSRRWWSQGLSFLPTAPSNTTLQLVALALFAEDAKNCGTRGFE